MNDKNNIEKRAFKYLIFGVTVGLVLTAIQASVVPMTILGFASNVGVFILPFTSIPYLKTFYNKIRRINN